MEVKIRCFFCIMYSFLIISCSNTYTGMGNLPSYLMYVQQAEPLADYSLELDVDSEFSMHFIEPGLFIEDFYLTYGWQAQLGFAVRRNNFSPTRVLLFDKDLKLLVDTAEIVATENPHWTTLSALAWQPRIDGTLDLGRQRFDPLPEQPTLSEMLSGMNHYRGHMEERYLYSASEDKEYRIEVYGSIDDITLFVRSSWDGSNDPEEETISINLMIDPLDKIIKELEEKKRAAHVAHYENIQEASLDLANHHTFYPQLLHSFTSHDKIFLVCYIPPAWDWIGLSAYIIFALDPADPFADPPENYSIIPAVHWDKPLFLYDGSHITVLDLPDDFDPKDRPNDMKDLLKILELRSYSYNDSDETWQEKTSYSWSRLFGTNTQPQRDIVLSMQQFEGNWFFFSRHTERIYRMVLGEASP